jgi:hypothetical protein
MKARNTIPRRGLGRDFHFACGTPPSPSKVHKVFEGKGLALDFELSTGAFCEESGGWLVDGPLIRGHLLSSTGPVKCGRASLECPLMRTDGITLGSAGYRG